MAIKITFYNPAAEAQKAAEEQQKELDAQLDLHKHLPKERYTCNDLFDLVHDPEGKGPCKPIKLGRRWSCSEDSHLDVVANAKREAQYAQLGISVEPYSSETEPDAHPKHTPT